jgi:hypothetical protein
MHSTRIQRSFVSGRRTVSAFWYVEWLWLSFNASGLEWADN